MKTYDRLSSQVHKLSSYIKVGSFHEKPVIIAIEGYGGSGKSTVAEMLKTELNDAFVVNFDDFIIKESINSADKSGFDKARLEDQVLKPAKKSKSISYQKLLWNENKLSNPITVPHVNYLIIEGVSAYNPKIAHYYDIKIWIETEMSTAMERGKKRDKLLGNNNDRLWEVWAKTDLEYQQKYNPHLEADFIIYNT